MHSDKQLGPYRWLCRHLLKLHYFVADSTVSCRCQWLSYKAVPTTSRHLCSCCAAMQPVSALLPATWLTVTCLPSLQAEIIEMHEPNSGRAPFATFLKRGPLPKVTPAAAGGAALPGQTRLAPEQCYMPADLRIGATVAVLGRNFLIYDCDAATRKWYTVSRGPQQGLQASMEAAEAVGRGAEDVLAGPALCADAGRPEEEQAPNSSACSLPLLCCRSTWALLRSSCRPLTSASLHPSAPPRRCRPTTASARPRTPCRTASSSSPSRRRRTSSAGAPCCQ